MHDTPSRIRCKASCTFQRMTVQAAPQMIPFQSPGGAENGGGEKWQVRGSAAGQGRDPAECEEAAGWDQQRSQWGTVEKPAQPGWTVCVAVSSHFKQFGFPLKVKKKMTWHACQRMSLVLFYILSYCQHIPWKDQNQRFVSHLNTFWLPYSMVH